MSDIAYANGFIAGLKDVADLCAQLEREPVTNDVERIASAFAGMLSKSIEEKIASVRDMIAPVEQMQ